MFSKIVMVVSISIIACKQISYRQLENTKLKNCGECDFDDEGKKTVELRETSLTIVPVKKGIYGKYERHR